MSRSARFLDYDCTLLHRTNSLACIVYLWSMHLPHLESRASRSMILVARCMWLIDESFLQAKPMSWQYPTQQFVPIDTEMLTESQDTASQHSELDIIQASFPSSLSNFPASSTYFVFYWALFKQTWHVKERYGCSFLCRDWMPNHLHSLPNLFWGLPSVEDILWIYKHIEDFLLARLYQWNTR